MRRAKLVLSSGRAVWDDGRICILAARASTENNKKSDKGIAAIFGAGSIVVSWFIAKWELLEERVVVL